MSGSSDARRFARELRAEGYSVIQSQKAYIVRSLATGRMVASFSITPSDGRWIKNAKSDIRRAERETS
jgi:hypothetical protein